MSYSSGKPSASSRRIHVSIIREVYLSLREVEDYIRKFEEKYQISSADFLRGAELRAQIPEDDIFQWEAFIDHRAAQRSVEEQLHREYLKTLKRESRESRTRSRFEQDCVAA